MSERAARRRATMVEVAHAAGVSVMTVSYTYGQPERVSADTRARVSRDPINGMSGRSRNR